MITACSGSDSSEPGPTPNPKPNPNPEDGVKYELSSNAIIVKSDVSEKIISADTASHVFHFAKALSESELPQEGQIIIINTPTAALPGGLLAKVTKVQTDSEGYAVSYTDAKLTDAFKTLDIPEQSINLSNYVKHVYDATGKELNFKRARGMEKGRDTLEVDIPIANWELAENVELTPNMHFVIDLLHLIHIEDWTLYSLAFKVNTDVTLGVTLSASAEKTFIDKSFLLMTFVCGAIPCGPVLVTPEVDVYGVVKVDGKISFEATISYTRRVTTNFTYAAGQGQNTTISSPDPGLDALNFNFTPKIEGSVAYGLSVGPSIGIFDKCLNVGVSIDMLNKEGISAQFDLFSYKDKKWSVFDWQGLDVSSHFTTRAQGHLYILDEDNSAATDDLDFLIDERKLFPSVSDNWSQSNEDRNFTINMKVTDKSLYYNNFILTLTSKDGKHVHTSSFDFNEKKWDKIENGSRNIDITSKITVNAGQVYDMDVTMSLGGITVPIKHIDDAISTEAMYEFGDEYSNEEFQLWMDYPNNGRLTILGKGHKSYDMILTAYYGISGKTINLYDVVTMNPKYVDNNPFTGLNGKEEASLHFKASKDSLTISTDGFSTTLFERKKITDGTWIADDGIHKLSIDFTGAYLTFTHKDSSNGIDYLDFAGDSWYDKDNIYFTMVGTGGNKNDIFPDMPLTNGASYTIPYTFSGNKLTLSYGSSSMTFQHK